MTLKDAKNGELYVVEESTIKQPVKRRLGAMGLTEGTMIRKINEALDGSIIFMVRGTRLAIGKELAEIINVRDVSDLEYEKRGRGMGHRKGFGKGRGTGHKKGCGMGHGKGFDKGHGMGRKRGAGHEGKGYSN